MSIFKQRINRRSFLKQAGVHILSITALNHLQSRTSPNSVLSALSASLYGSGSYGTLTYGYPLESDERTPLSPDSQIFIPLIIKEQK